MRLVAERGDAMQAAADDRAGTMAAVLGLDDDDVEVACAQVDGDVWVANYNAPGQVVIAGCPEAIERATAAAKELGAKKVMPVAVSGAFHTPFMAPARDRLRKAIADADLRDGDIPVFANVDAAAHTAADEWAGLLAAQLCSPVRWRQTLHAMAEAGCATFVELGPGTRADRHGQADGPRRQAPGGQHARRPRPAARGHRGHPADRARSARTRASTSSPRSEWSSARAPACSSPAAEVGEGTAVEPGQVVGTVGGQEVRSPVRGHPDGRAGRSRVNGSRPASPSPGCESR